MSDTIDQSSGSLSSQQCGGVELLVVPAESGLGWQSCRFFGPGVTGMSLSQTSEFSHASIA